MNPINNPHDLCLAYLGGDLDEAASRAFEMQLESDPAIAECLLQQSETWVTVATSMQRGGAAVASTSTLHTALAPSKKTLSTKTPATIRFAFIAVAIAASTALFVFGFNHIGNHNEETLLAQTWADQSTLATQLEPLDPLSSDMAELQIAELGNNAADLSPEEDSFDWMLVAVSDQWNAQNGESQRPQNSMGGSSDEG